MAVPKFMKEWAQKKVKKLAGEGNSPLNPNDVPNNIGNLVDPEATTGRFSAISGHLSNHWKKYAGVSILSLGSMGVQDKLKDHDMIEDNSILDTALSYASYPAGVIGSIPNPVRAIANIAGMELAGGNDQLGVTLLKWRYNNPIGGTRLLNEHIEEFLENYNDISPFKREAVSETVTEHLGKNEAPFKDPRATVMFYKADQIASSLLQDTADYRKHIEMLGSTGNAAALEVLKRFDERKQEALDQKEKSLASEGKKIVTDNATSFIKKTQAGADTYVQQKLKDIEGEPVDNVMKRVSFATKNAGISIPQNVLQNIRSVMNNVAQQDGNAGLNKEEARQSITNNAEFTEAVKGLEFKQRHVIRQAVLEAG